MYREYMASAPPLSLENETPRLNGVAKRIGSTSPRALLAQQDSTETNHSDDIQPSIRDNKDIFTVESQIAKLEHKKIDLKPVTSKETLPEEKNKLPNGEGLVENGESNTNDLPSILRSRRNLLEPISIKRDVPVPSWSLAKGPCVVSMIRKSKNLDEDGKLEKIR